MEASRLRGIALFDGLSDAELDRVAGWFELEEVLQGTVLAKEGEFAYRFFVVLDGEVEVLADFDSIRRMGPGDHFGEIGASTAKRRTARVVAHSRCELASMLPWDFTTMLEEFPDVSARIEAVAHQRLTDDQQR